MSATESECFDPEKIRIRRNDKGNIILVNEDGRAAGEGVTLF